ncbi:SigB/SigF/SigG family RNA polymerase sigma factor [Streptomyces clavuligerus]|uniref:Putative RNA polymerase sigma factor n=1 Tax=Streptomyces clavuligerus TaxID=1901 RepID=E2Q721_STRCL|nr:SigB/SigF/SigG family RNA polymerase sigma factor [Streptomyces clavuligerus]ANW21563.1 RNA polymerase subunit sigma [Streptomyces clavuligerus]AXU16193.1 SigB/SigF/SigG family RNA polymerase sigma factor [Streptomyces clavuligerus]EFG05268.1 Putative RNA polymerase sigma factor [Streptomyces clavuligerus]MBY6306344.1 SigB/SigF/SigG family RNA polymerase sigma factor [Streptomyces clavuligerus]QCS08972.1 SigB/SigF/SigG family RNA polymerase sigma factor [Streptomyces clavuligerus]
MRTPTSTAHTADRVRSPARGARHPHDDAPDTAAAFARLARLPDGPEREALRQELVNAWLPMSERLARRFRDRGESLEDLRQVAALGLVKAVDRYDPARGCAFASFAVPTITGEVKRHFRDHMWTLHVPRRVQDQRNRVRAAQQELAQTVTGRAPTEAEIAERAGLTPAQTREGLAAIGSYRTLSLDAEAPGDGDGCTMADALGGPDPALDVVIDREAVRPRLRELPERERRILYMRFFRGMTQSRIAEDLGISQMHVSRLISHSCDRLRQEIMRDAV